MTTTPRKPKTPSPKPAPIGGLYDRDPVTGANRFKYVSAASTNVKATLDRVRAEMAAGKRPL